MLEAVTNMFARRDPRREAKLGLARIITRYDMTRLSYEEGISEDRRVRDERHVALGVWLFPSTENAKAEDLNVETGVPAVTHDLRSDGIGIMTPVRLEHDHFVVATPDEDSGWRFFQCAVRHNTRKPGGWYQLGVQVKSVLILDGDKRIGFRNHIADVCTDD